MKKFITRVLRRVQGFFFPETKIIQKLEIQAALIETLLQEVATLREQTRGLRFSFGEFQGGVNKKLNDQAEILLGLVELHSTKGD